MGSSSLPAPRSDNEAHNDGYRDEHDEPIHEVPISHSRDDSASAKGAAPYLLINPTYGGWYRSPVQTVAGRTLPEHVRTRIGQQAASTWGAGTTIAPGVTTIAPGVWRPNTELREERNVEEVGRGSPPLQGLKTPRPTVTRGGAWLYGAPRPPRVSPYATDVPAAEM